MPHIPLVLSFIPVMISADLRVTFSSLTLEQSAATGIATPIPCPDFLPKIFHRKGLVGIHEFILGSQVLLMQSNALLKVDMETECNKHAYHISTGETGATGP